MREVHGRPQFAGENAITELQGNMLISFNKSSRLIRMAAFSVSAVLVTGFTTSVSYQVAGPQAAPATAVSGASEAATANPHPPLVTNPDAPHDRLADGSAHRPAAFEVVADSPWYWQPTLSGLDGSRANPAFAAAEPRHTPMPKALIGIGFPHIETGGRPAERLYKPYAPLIAFVGEDNRQAVPAIACMGLSPARVAARATRYERDILSMSIQHGVSASLVKAVIAEESCFNHEARSHAGAIGMMQLMPDTASWLKVSDPLDPRQNIDGGIRYLAWLQTQFDSHELVLAAYNAGPGNVRKHDGVPPYTETMNYVDSVLANYRRYVATTRYTNESLLRQANVAGVDEQLASASR